MIRLVPFQLEISPECPFGDRRRAVVTVSSSVISAWRPAGRRSRSRLVAQPLMFLRMDVQAQVVEGRYGQSTCVLALDQQAERSFISPCGLLVKATATMVFAP